MRSKDLPFNSPPHEEGGGGGQDAANNPLLTSPIKGEELVGGHRLRHKLGGIGGRAPPPTFPSLGGRGKGRGRTEERNS